MKLFIEIDEMRSRIRCKTQQCWLWHAINHENGDVITYVLSFIKLPSLKKLTAFIPNLNLNISCIGITKNE